MSYSHNPYHALTTNYRYGCRCDICSANESRRYRAARRTLANKKPDPPILFMNGPLRNETMRVENATALIRVPKGNDVFVYGSSTMTKLLDGASTVGFIYLHSEPSETAPREPAPI